MNIVKRSISSARFLNKTYNSKPYVQRYIEAKLKEACAANGLDTRGAETAYVSGGGHSGGADPTERFHITYEVKKADGSHLTTRHLYIANDKDELDNDAKAWDSAK